MVSNNVSFNGNNYPTQSLSYIKGLSDVANYLCGVEKEREENPFAGFSSMIGFTAAIELPKAIKEMYRWSDGFKNAENFKTAWDKDMQTIKENSRMRNAIFGANGIENPKSYKAYFEYTKKVKEAEEAEKAVIKLEEKSAGKGIFNKIAEFFTGTFRGKEKIETRRAKATEEIATAKKTETEAKNVVESLRNFEKVEETAKSTGKLTEQVLATAGKEVSMGTKALNCVKANGLFAIIEGAMETFTEIIPAFKQSTDSGIKQLGKSTIKIGVSVGGWAAGEAIGMAIGSVLFPGVGTLVGGLAGTLIGMVGGTIGSWAAEKALPIIANAIGCPNLVKSEVAISKEEQAKSLVAQANQNPEVAQQLMQAAAQKIQQEGASSDEAKLAFGSLQNLAQMTQSQAKAPTNASQYAQYNPNSTTGNNPFDMDKDFMAQSVGLS